MGLLEEELDRLIAAGDELIETLAQRMRRKLKEELERILQAAERIPVEEPFRTFREALTQPVKGAREVSDDENQSDQPADAGEMVAEQPEHPAGPMPDPGEGYRILSKDPQEELLPNDEYELAPGGWIKSERARTTRIQDATIWYRRKIEPAEPLPAWEPKVGDWVKVTRPENWGECSAPRWDESMHQFDGKVVQVERELEGRFYIGGFIASNGWQYQFHRDWLSPAAPEEPPKPSEPEYREPVLPGDAGKKCEFSDNGELWDTLKLAGWNDFPVGWHWKSRTARGEVHSWKRCRIRKDS